jgi:hypothetical protein
VASWQRVAVGPYLGGGKRNGQGERISCQTSPFLGDGERETRCPGPARWQQPANGSSERLDRSARHIPCSGSLTGGPQSVFLKVS